jgi:hypothetical protein
VLAATAGLSGVFVTLDLLRAVALLSCVGLAGTALARLALPTAPRPSRVSAAFCFAAALLVLPATVLGHAGLLVPRTFFLLEAVLTAAMVAAASLRPGATGGRYVAEPDAAAGATASPAPPWERAIHGAAWAAVLATVVVTMHRDRYRPPFHLDDPSYHFTTVATWVQHEDLRTPLFNYGDPSPAFYPLGSELVAWSLVAPLGDDFLARWLQLPYLAALLVAAAAVGRRVGLGTAAASLSALLLLTVHRLFPVLFLSGGNDLVYAAYLVAAVDALLALGRRRSAGHALYLGTALGLAFGTKYLALVQGLPLLVAVLVLPLLAGRKNGAGVAATGVGRSHAAALALTGVAMAVTGGYTYLRNLVTTGNPVFPLPLDLGPLHLPGWHEVTLAVRRHLPIFALDPWHFLAVDGTLWGPLFRFTLLPAALLAPWVPVWRLRPGWRLRAFVLTLPALHFAGFVERVHDHRDVRYLFAAAALAAVAFGVLAEAARQRHPRLAAVARGAPVLAAFPFFVPGDGMALLPRALLATALIVCGATCALAGGAALRRPARALRRTGRRLARWAPTLVGLLRRPVVPCALGALVLVLAVAPTAGRYPAHALAADPVTAELARRAPSGAAVAVVGGNRPYSLFGPRFENWVEIVPVSGPPERRHYTWGGDGERPARHGTADTWLANLRAVGVGHVVIDKGPEPVRERAWIAARRDQFRLLLVHGDRELWQLLPAPEQR